MLCLCCLWEHFLFRISQHKRLISLSFILHLPSLIQQPLFCHSFFHLPVKWVMFFVFTQISYVIPLLRIKKRFNYDCRCELELCVFLVSFFFSVLFYLSISCFSHSKNHSWFDHQEISTCIDHYFSSILHGVFFFFFCQIAFWCWP